MKSVEILKFINPISTSSITNIEDFKEYLNNPNCYTLIEDTFFNNIKSIIKKICDNKIAGDIVNIGVFKGGGSLYMKSLFEEERSYKQWWLFDSFCGFNKQTLTKKKDINSLNLFEKKLNYELMFPDEIQVYKLFKIFHLEKNITIIKGFIEDVLQHQEIEKISFLHIDVDFYNPTYYSLEMLYPKLNKGGWVIIDDYYHEMFDCKEAVDAFISKNNIICDIIRLGKYAAGWQK